MKKFFIALLTFSPSLALAQQNQANFENVFSLADTVARLMAKVIPIILGAAVILFLWGVLKFITAKDADKQKEGRSFMLYGIVALFVMVSVWGLVNFLRSAFGFNTNAITPPSAPLLPGYTR
jgi:hypothetical protein